MSVIVVMLALAAIKKQILAALEGWKAQLPDPMKPIADQVSLFIGGVIDGIDAAALAASLPGQVIDLIKTGHGPSAPNPADTA